MLKSPRLVVLSRQNKPKIPDPKVYSELFLSDDRLEMPHVAILPETKSFKTSK
jgi:hypothetical protein